MALFLIVANDENGDNMDFFVRAPDADKAREYYDAMIEQEEMNDYDHRYGPRIYPVPDAYGEDGVVEWEDLILKAAQS